MVDTVGVVDEQPYPGPRVSGPWSNPDSDPLGDIKAVFAAYGAALGEAGRRIAEHYEANMRGIVEYLSIHGEADTKPDLVDPVVAKRNRNVGPRSGSTFDRHGRRRF